MENDGMSNDACLFLSLTKELELSEKFKFPILPIKPSELILPSADIESLSINDTQVKHPEMTENNSDSPEKRLSDVLHENTTLKETLHQNNLAMKQQFNTLCLWQEELLKVHQNHKERFEETKKLIIKLMAENKELKVQKSRGSVDKSGLRQLKAENEELQKHLIEAGQQLTSLLAKANNRRKSQQTVKEKELGSVVEMLTERLEIAERARRQLEIDVERLTAQKSRLEQKLIEKDSLGKSFSGPEIIRSDSEVMQQIKAFLHNFDKSPQPESSVEIDAESDDAAILNEKINYLKSILAKEKENVKKMKKYLGMAASEYDVLLNVYLKNVSEAANINSSNESAAPQLSEAHTMESMDLLLARIVSREEELFFKNEQIDKLRMRMQAIENENEAIPILKAQVSVYQSDFNIERKNREDLAAEREKLLADMRLLLKQNKQLMEELDSIHTGQSTLKIEPVEKKNINEVGEDVGEYICPNPECSMRFTLVEPLQVHVEQCLKLTD